MNEEDGSRLMIEKKKGMLMHGWGWWDHTMAIKI
jgi:hypothetical protein